MAQKKPDLPPWVIEEENEKERRRRDDRPQPQLPLDEPAEDPTPSPGPEKKDGEKRGVIIIGPDGDEEGANSGAVIIPILRF